jgi:hypothetical protein
VQAGPDAIIDRIPLLRGEVGDQTLDGLDEAVRHGALVDSGGWYQGQGWPALMGHETTLGTCVCTHIRLTEGGENGQTNTGGMGML